MLIILAEYQGKTRKISSKKTKEQFMDIINKGSEIGIHAQLVEGGEIYFPPEAFSRTVFTIYETKD